MYMKLHAAFGIAFRAYTFQFVPHTLFTHSSNAPRASRPCSPTTDDTRNFHGSCVYYWKAVQPHVAPRIWRVTLIWRERHATSARPRDAAAANKRWAMRCEWHSLLSACVCNDCTYLGLTNLLLSDALFFSVCSIIISSSNNRKLKPFLSLKINLQIVWGLK